MDLLQLKYFCHAASTLNFSQTAQFFFVPPSNISQCIKRLENELQIPLFIRSSNRVRLSPQGELFYKGIQKALNLIDSTTEAVKTSVSERSVHIAISLHRQYVMRIIDSFRAKYPDVEILCSRPHDPAASFSFDGYDIIIDGHAYNEPEYERELLAHNKIILFAPKNMLCADSITPEVLERQTFISHPFGSYMYSNTQRLCRDMKISPVILTQEDYSIYFIPRCIEEKRGIAFAPIKTGWAVHMAEYLDAFDVGEYYQDIYLYSRKDTFSPYIMTLKSSIIEQYRKTRLEGNDLKRPLHKIISTPMTQAEHLPKNK